MKKKHDNFCFNLTIKMVEEEKKKLTSTVVPREGDVINCHISLVGRATNTLKHHLYKTMHVTEYSNRTL